MTRSSAPLLLLSLLLPVPSFAAPLAYQICASNAVILPAKPSGDPWDVGGQKVAQQALSKLIAAAAAGPAALGFAVAAPVFLSATGKPDIYVKMYGNNRLLARSWTIRDSLEPQWSPEGGGACTYGQPNARACRNCVLIPATAADLWLFRVELWDEDLSADDPVGAINFKGIPRPALATGVLRLRPFSAVLALVFTIRAIGPASQPTTRPATRPSLGL